MLKRLFKNLFLRRYLKKRMIMEKHLRNGGCFFCDPDGVWARIATTRFSAYLYASSLTWALPPCPVGKEEDATKVIDDLKVRNG